MKDIIESPVVRKMIDKLTDITDIRFNVCVSKEPVFDLVRKHLLLSGAKIETSAKGYTVVLSDGRYSLLTIIGYVVDDILEDYATVHRYNVVDVDFNKGTKQ